ncbi:ABC-2 family transporter protein [Patescibacteria group bacterium]|nr:ABC-2 family transporter protein [Patescibacteria group bacterium]
MRKYYIIARNTWYEALTYRASFVMWRVRNIIQLLTIYFLWLVVLPPGKSILGYSHSLMLTYILGTSLIDSIVLSSRTYAVGEEINSGNLMNFLLRPINYFLYWFSKDIGDKAMNICFSIAELTLIFIILRPPFFIQTNPLYILLFIFSVILSLVLYFFINFLLGLIGFWSPEVWAPRFIFITLLGFFAGSLFPLDILPKAIYEVLRFLPFTYLLYFPLKIYLGQLSFPQIASGLAISAFWVFAIYFLVNVIWQKGLKSYTAYGR